MALVFRNAAEATYLAKLADFKNARFSSICTELRVVNSQLPFPALTWDILLH